MARALRAALYRSELERAGFFVATAPWKTNHSRGRTDASKHSGGRGDLGRFAKRRKPRRDACFAISFEVMGAGHAEAAIRKHFRSRAGLDRQPDARES